MKNKKDRTQYPWSLGQPSLTWGLKYTKWDYLKKKKDKETGEISEVIITEIS